MTDILEEVLRDQSDEKKLHYFRKILPIVILFTIVTVIAMLVYNWHQDDLTKRNMQIGDAFVKSLANIDKKYTDEALLNLIKDNQDSKIAEIAALKRTGIKITENDVEGAKILLEEIINNTNYQSLTTSFAKITWASLVIDKPKLSDNEKELLQEYLKFFNNEDQEFFGTASLLMAVWYKQSGQAELAGEILRNIRSAENLPAIIKEQAKVLMSQIDIRMP